MTTFTEKLNEWYHYIATHSVIVSGGAARSICPLCSGDHVICRFTSGDLGCVVPRCENPHHRSWMAGR